MKIKNQKRGQLTDRIKKKSAELLGYEISQTELRLMPYVQYTLLNEKRLNPQAINQLEQKILAEWELRGFVIEGISTNLGRPLIGENKEFKVTKKFWEAMSEIIWLGYVDLY